MTWLHTPPNVQSHLQKWIPFDAPPAGTQVVKSSASRLLVQLNRSLWQDEPTPWQSLQFLREFIKVHPLLKNEKVSRLWHEVAFLSALRKNRVAPPLLLAYRIDYHFTGKLPESLRPWLKKKV